jgi:hypothetical protein
MPRGRMSPIQSDPIELVGTTASTGRNRNTVLKLDVLAGAA